MSKLQKKIIAFIFLYLVLTTFFIYIYFQSGNLFESSLGLQGKNIARWNRSDIINIFSSVGVFMAPLAVLFGFTTWKEQQFESSKIKAIENIKRILLEQKEILDDFRCGNNYDLISLNKLDEFESNKNQLINQFEKYHLAILNILKKDGFYFRYENKHLMNFYYFNNKVSEVLMVIERADFWLKKPRSTSGKIIAQNGDEINEDDYRILQAYLIQPYNLSVRTQFGIDKNLKESCEREEELTINTPFNDFYYYLNKILEKSYRV